MLLFQSTRPRGARRASCHDTPSMTRFNPRAREGRDKLPSMPYCKRSRFNPRAREGRDNILHQREHHKLVSIHAPARGATSRMACRRNFCSFQSTRPRGARLCYKRFVKSFLRFNPRAREGRDL